MGLELHRELTVEEYHIHFCPYVPKLEYTILKLEQRQRSFNVQALSILASSNNLLAQMDEHIILPGEAGYDDEAYLLKLKELDEELHDWIEKAPIVLDNVEDAIWISNTLRENSWVTDKASASTWPRKRKDGKKQIVSVCYDSDDNSLNARAELDIADKQKWPTLEEAARIEERWFEDFFDFDDYVNS